MSQKIIDVEAEGNKLTKFKGNKNIEIISEFKNLSIIQELKANKMICVANCKLIESCKTVESKNNEICQLHNETAFKYLVEKTEKQDEFIYFKDM